MKITLLDGTIISARFDSASDSLLRVKESKKTLREIPGSTVKEITKKRPESGWNGVLIGFGVGVAAGLVAVGTTCSNDSECSANATAVFLPIFAGGGAAVGAIIDRSVETYDPIYVQPATADRLRLNLTPVVSKDVRALQLSISF